MLADGTISQAVPVALPKVFADGLTGLTDGGTLDAGGFVTLVFLVAATARIDPRDTSCPPWRSGRIRK